MTPDIPQEPPGPGMPPDPFTAADAAYAVIYSEFTGLRKAGASIVEAAMLTAAHIIVNRVAGHEPPPPPPAP